MNRCPLCGQPVRGLSEEGPWWVSWPCGDRLTQDQAIHIRHARGDDT